MLINLIFIIAFSLLTSGITNSVQAHESHWITNSQSQSKSNTWLCFRKDLQVNKLGTSNSIKVAADSKYWMWVNGEMVVFEGSVKRGPNPKDTYYDTIELTPYLHEGVNQIAVLLWYFGKEGFSYQPSGKAGLFIESLSPELELNTNKSWKSSIHLGYYTPQGIQPNFRISESNIGYDARKFSEDWMTTPANELWNSWSFAIEVGTEGSEPWNKLHHRIIPQWKNHGLKSYETIIRREGKEVDTLVCALPYNLQMTPYFELDCEAGLRIGVETDHYKGGGMYNVRAEYITKAGYQRYESLGWMNGHNVYYIIPHNLHLHKLAYRETSYDTEFTGSFTCNDPFFNQLWNKAQRTLLVTMRDTYMDCPDRERAQWWGDEVIEAGESFYALCPKSHLLMKKGMYELIGWQKADGTIFAPIPASNYHTELPGQMLASIGLYGFWNYYLNTGDKQTIADLYEGVKRYLQVWEYSPNGTVKFRAGDWTWGDWGTNVDIEGLFNAWYYLALQGAAKMAEVLNLPQDAEAYKFQMSALKKAFNATFWKGYAYRCDMKLPDPDDRLQALAVLAGIAESSKYQAIIKLFDTYEYASPYMEKYVLEALFVMNEPQRALNRMKKRFGPMVAHELTTLFEGWGIGAAGFGGGTTNHAWSGGGLTLLAQKVCGIAPIEPGFKVFTVCPQMGYLTHAKTQFETINGQISINLTKEKHLLQMKLYVPEGTAARVPIQKRISSVTLNQNEVIKKQIVKDNKYCITDAKTGNKSLLLPVGEWLIELRDR